MIRGGLRWHVWPHTLPGEGHVVGGWRTIMNERSSGEVSSHGRPPMLSSGGYAVGGGRTMLDGLSSAPASSNVWCPTAFCQIDGRSGRGRRSLSLDRLLLQGRSALNWSRTLFGRGDGDGDRGRRRSSSR